MYALVPVLGVVMVVLYADKGTIVAKILSAKVLVGIGLISYSAYLWHQPLFAFARIQVIPYPSDSLMILLVLSSFALAFISWKLIEQPFRNRVFIGSRSVFLYTSIFATSFIIIGFYGNSNISANHQDSVGRVVDSGDKLHTYTG